jgi:hypothetical protein
MPYATDTAPFTGDNNMGDFMLAVWLPFARDDVNWVDNQSPSPGTEPNVVQVWTHMGSVTTPEGPYVFFEVPDNNGSCLAIATGTGVDTSEQFWDQPGNPANGYDGSSFNAGFRTGSQVSFSRHTIPIMGGMGDGIAAYWLFAPTTGDYVHCVIKISARHYRHFIVGRMKHLVPDLDPECFYVCQNLWSDVGPDYAVYTSGPAANSNHAPYSSPNQSILGNMIGGASLDGNKTQHANRLWIPDVRTGVEWWHALEETVGEGSITSRASNGNNDTITTGYARLTGYAGGLGAGLFMCDESFTAGTVPLIPCLVGVSQVFESQERWGVVGQIPDVFRINMKNYVPEQEITVGSDTYVIFPVINNNNADVTSDDGYSGYEGIAYKKITGAVA